VLDFLVTEEQLGVTLVSAAIENAPGTPSEAFLPVLRNGVTQEYLHVEALKEAGGKPLTTKYWFPDASLDNGGIGVFETLEVIETIEISLYLIGVSAFARRGDDLGARLCAEAMGTEAVHRALVRFAQGELGKEIGPPNDVGFENLTGYARRGPRGPRGTRHRLRSRDLTARQVLRIPRGPARQRPRHSCQPHRATLNEPPHGARPRPARAAHTHAKRQDPCPQGSRGAHAPAAWSAPQTRARTRALPDATGRPTRDP
jgi:hypothetical protein